MGRKPLSLKKKKRVEPKKKKKEKGWHWKQRLSMEIAAKKVWRKEDDHLLGKYIREAFELRKITTKF